jgi:hypothetical protein
MSQSGGTLETIVRHLALAVQPLRSAFANLAAFKRLMYRLGWNVQSLPPAYQSLGALVDEISTALAAIEASPSEADLSAVLDLLHKVRTLYQAIAGLTDAPAGVDAATFLAEVRERLFELLLVDYLAAALRPVYQTLVTLGIITVEARGASGDGPPNVRTRLRTDRVRDLIADPSSLPRVIYGWGEDNLNTTMLFSHLREVLEHTGALVSFGSASTDLVAGYMGVGAPRSSLKVTVFETTVGDEPLEVAFVLLPLPREGGHKAGLVLQPMVPDLGGDRQIGSALHLKIRPNTDPSTLFGIVIRPDELSIRYPFGSGTGVPQVGFSIALDYRPDTETLLLGDAATTRLSMHGAAASMDLNAHQDGLELKAGLTLNGLNLVLASKDQDGFLGTLIGDQDVTIPIPLSVQWSSRSGVSFVGGTGFTLSQPAHLSLGSVTIQGLTLALRTTTDVGHAPDLIIEAGASFGGSIGPIAFATDNVGLRLSAVFHDGNAGPFDIALGFKPPSGIGLSVEAQGAVTGGGFLFHDPAQHLYAGLMQLSLDDRFTLTAFGLIATRMPDGSRGYSLIIFITAEDFEPIPLGLGFTLQGIGGMIAVNRTFDQDVLRAGMQNDMLKSLLFPRDPVGNAPAIIRSLASAFPAQRGSYLLGILAKIDWFTPTLIELDLALILEFGARERLLVLGRISSLLPSADNDLVRINLDAIGVLDFDQNTAAIDAVLVDSRLVHKYALTGAAALRAGWGSAESTDFVLSIGGFNPRFAPPAGVPPLARVAIALSSGANPRLTCDAYFAITSNTIQFGAEAQLYAEAYGFSISGDVGYDVLIARAPLHFIADFHASVQLKHGSDNLFKVSVEGELEGPLPLRLSGKASFEILWCHFSVHFDTTLVQGEPPPLPPAVDVLAQLETALSTPQSWSTQLAPIRTHGVALRKLSPGSGLVLDPLGRLAVNESVVPLDTGRDIDSFGGAPVSGARRFTLSVALNGVALTETQPLQGRFAPAQFFAMSDDEELASPPFETMDSGFMVGTDSVSFDPSQLVAAPVKYQAITIDPLAATPPPPGSYALPASRLALHSASGAAARAPLRRSGRARFRSAAPAAVSLAQPSWAIVPLDGGTPVTLDPSVKTWTDYRAALAALNRGGANFQLVPAREIAA